MPTYGVGNAIVFESAGQLTNPSAGDVAADTGALAAGTYELRYVVGGSVASISTINRRNAANGAAVGDQPLIYAAAGASQTGRLTMTLETDERVRITVGALTGTYCALITAERLS